MKILNQYYCWNHCYWHCLNQSYWNSLDWKKSEYPKACVALNCTWERHWNWPWHRPQQYLLKMVVGGRVVNKKWKAAKRVGGRMEDVKVADVKVADVKVADVKVDEVVERVAEVLLCPHSHEVCYAHCLAYHRTPMALIFDAGNVVVAVGMVVRIVGADPMEKRKRRQPHDTSEVVDVVVLVVLLLVVVVVFLNYCHDVGVVALRRLVLRVVVHLVVVVVGSKVAPFWVYESSYPTFPPAANVAHLVAHLVARLVAHLVAHFVAPVHHLGCVAVVVAVGVAIHCWYFFLEEVHCFVDLHYSWV